MSGQRWLLLARVPAFEGDTGLKIISDCYLIFLFILKGFMKDRLCQELLWVMHQARGTRMRTRRTIRKSRRVKYDAFERHLEESEANLPAP